MQVLSVWGTPCPRLVISGQLSNHDIGAGGRGQWAEVTAVADPLSGGEVSQHGRIQHRARTPRVSPRTERPATCSDKPSPAGSSPHGVGSPE